MTELKAPFPWFGGKSKIASLVWSRFGEITNYVEPFFGSGAVLLGAPRPTKYETINDIDGYICNFWRAVQNAPDEVVKFCDSPRNENDFHARHAWLVAQKKDFVPRLEGDPTFYDAKIAGWWVWGICMSIGHGFVSGKGPWSVVGGQLQRVDGVGGGVRRSLPRVSGGAGIHKVSLQDGGGGVKRCLPEIARGRGVHRISLRDGCKHPPSAYTQNLRDWFVALQDRLRFVKVACGDWSRVCGKSGTTELGLTGVFLDPPYSAPTIRSKKIYTDYSLTVSNDVRKWCIDKGDDPHMRIALCGYEGEHAMPDTWDCVAWRTNGGYANHNKTNKNKNKKRERIWFSPHCLQADNPVLFGEKDMV